MRGESHLRIMQTGMFILAGLLLYLFDIQCDQHLYFKRQYPYLFKLIETFMEYSILHSENRAKRLFRIASVSRSFLVMAFIFPFRKTHITLSPINLSIRPLYFLLMSSVFSKKG